LNEFIYYPIFLITTSSILFSVSLIFYLKDFDNSLLRGSLFALTGGLLTSGFCIAGQSIENESVQLHDVAKELPWYLWSLPNRRIYLILLTKSQMYAMLSSSGIVIINHTLFISLYKKISSVLTFFMNV
ncbi:unnamed protein product, partial [Tenebrio molitor]